MPPASRGVRRISANGQVSLGVSFAGRFVHVVRIGDGFAVRLLADEEAAAALTGGVPLPSPMFPAGLAVDDESDAAVDEFFELVHEVQARRLPPSVLEKFRPFDSEDDGAPLSDVIEPW